MKTRLLSWGSIGMAAAIFLSCSDDEKTKTLPEITTSTVTNVTATSATGGGEIVSNGNAEITARGLVYSSTNATPTLSDSKTTVIGTDDSFTSDLEGLTSGATYHVRAYATNSIGTGYGEVVDFTTNNVAPTAANVAIEGTVEVDQEVSADYDYNDAEGDTESGSEFQWYVADDIAGSGEVAIDGATSETYIIDIDYEFKYLSVGVTPANSAGAGVEVKSDFIQVAVSTTKVRFTYNGEEVAYGIIESTNTGRQWLDRNLGASQAATSYNDYLAYGHLFQWGRLDDGHQVITWDAVRHTSFVSATTPTLSTTDVPGNSSFIYEPSPAVGDWRTTPNDNLWQAQAGQINNPCPTGWHIPTNAEWDAEIAGTENVADVLKLTTGHRREFLTHASVMVPGDASPNIGYYWSSTIDTAPSSWYYRVIANDGAGLYEDLVKHSIDYRGYGYSCRCIKD